MRSEHCSECIRKQHHSIFVEQYINHSFALNGKFVFLLFKIDIINYASAEYTTVAVAASEGQNNIYDDAYNSNYIINEKDETDHANGRSAKRERGE